MTATGSCPVAGLKERLKDRILFIPQFQARETCRPDFIELQLHCGL